MTRMRSRRQIPPSQSECRNFMATRTLPWISSELPADLFPSKSGFSPSSQTVGTVIDIFSLFVSLSVNVYVCVCVCVCVVFFNGYP